MMSENEEQRPLTRRERRLREMAESSRAAQTTPEDDGRAASPGADSPGADDAEDEAGSAPADAAPTNEDPTDPARAAGPGPGAASASAADAIDPNSIEISPYDENGSPRTRREIRELREQALARLQAEAAAQAAEEAQASAEPEMVPPAPADDSDASSAPEAHVAERPLEEPVIEEPVVEDAPIADEPVEEPAAGASVAEEPAEETVAEQPVEETPVEEVAAKAPEEHGAPDESVASTRADDPPIDDELEATEEYVEEDLDAPVPPTAPFTLDELREAEGTPGAAETRSFDLSDFPIAAPEQAPAEEAGEIGTEPEQSGDPAAKSKKKGFWRRNKPEPEEPRDEPGAPFVSDVSQPPVTENLSFDDALAGLAHPPADPQGDAAAPESAVPDEPAVSEPAAPEPAADEASAAEPEPEPEPEPPMVPEPPADPRPAVEPEAPAARAPFIEPEPEAPAEAEEVLPQAPAESEQAQEPEAHAGTDPDESAQRQGYSFPDIAPPEEWRSVFDDDSRAAPTVNDARSASGKDAGFDDLIARAVVQDGAVNSSNSAALILPDMPTDSGIAGPIGETGELYITGSISVPKSIGETGGHASIHDSVELDPIEEMGAERPSGPDQSTGPIAARSAVSAVTQTGVPSMAKATKDRSKLPLILSLTGGGLVIVVGGIVIWAVTTGAFG